MFDYDRTLTLDDLKIPASTRETLIQVRKEKLATLGIVSGRTAPFLKSINEELSGAFSFLVAENGAVIYDAELNREDVYGKEWTLRARELFSGSRFEVRFGEVMGASKVENERELTRLLAEAGLKSTLVRNIDSFLLLPPGMGKGWGVSKAIEKYGKRDEIELTSFGDGENDVSLFEPADFRVAVSNAVEELKQIADFVTKSPGGLGVEEYIRNRFMLRD